MGGALSAEAGSHPPPLILANESEGKRERESQPDSDTQRSAFSVSASNPHALQASRQERESERERAIPPQRRKGVPGHGSARRPFPNGRKRESEREKTTTREQAGWCMIMYIKRSKKR